MFNEVRFDLRLTPDGSLSVHATSKVLPEEWADTASAEQLEQLRLLRERLAKHQITEAELVRMGLLLGDALVPDSIQEPLARRVASPDEHGVRMRIVVHDAELAALPWEYVRLPSRFDELGGSPLALDQRVSLLRSPAKGAAATNPTLRGNDELRVLHASATSVEGFDPLRGDDHAVDLALWGESGSRRTRRVVVDRLSDPATRESLEEALSAGPDLFVFTGHSTADDGRASLVLADEHGRPDLVGGGELAAMLLRSGTPLVVLNACDTATSDDTDVSLAEQLVRSGVGTAIGMQMPISDSNAGHFAVGLVGALGEGLPVDVAVTQGRRRVADRAGFSEWGIPTLVSSSRVEEPIDGVTQPRTRSGELVGAGAGSGDVARGGLSTAAPRTPPPSGGDAPTRGRGPLVGAIVLVIALLGAGFWLLTGDDGEDTAADPTVAGKVEEQQPQDTVPESYLDLNGWFDPELLTSGTPSPTSAALEQLVAEWVGYLSVVDPDVDSESGRKTEPKDLGLPGVPARANYAATNVERNSDCWKVFLHDLMVVGAAGRELGLSGGRVAALRLVEFNDETDAEQFFWATTMNAGLKDDECRGWPAATDMGSIAVDPERLEIRRRDFSIPTEDVGRPDALLTAKGDNVDLESLVLRSAYVGVFRYDEVVGLAVMGSLTDPLNENDAKSAITEAVRISAGN